MGKGIYEFSFDTGSKARWVREPDGRIVYWSDDVWKFRLSPSTWAEIVKAMSQEPIRSDEIPIMGEIIGWRCWRWFGEDLLWFSPPTILLATACDRGRTCGG